ncbi:MAG: tetratricopeptide repeat protein [Bacteroidales bacterium]|nr:tetratricopeptide repeat protein [Bacteroidales bacterium]
MILLLNIMLLFCPLAAEGPVGIAGDDDVVQKKDTGELPLKDTLIFFSENFNDGDFTLNPEWKEDIRQTCAPEPPTIKVTDGVLRSFQAGAGTCGNNAAIETDLNIPVSDSTKIRFDVKPSYSTVDEGAGWFDVEYPAYIIIWLTDQDNRLMRLMFGYNYRGGESFYEKDNISLAFPSCRQDEWIRSEVFVLRKYYPAAKLIKRIKVGSSGWDYSGYFDNIMIFNDSPDRFSGSVINTDYRVPAIESGGTGYGSVNKQDKAIGKFKADLEMNKRLGNMMTVNKFCYLVGNSYLNAGNYDSAMVYLQQSLELSKMLPDYDAVIITMRRMAEVYLIWNEYGKALDMYNELLARYEEREDLDGILFSLNGVAEIQFLTGNSTAAIEFYQRLLDLNRQKGHSAEVAVTLENLGNVYSRTGQARLALQCFTQSMKIHEKEGDFNSLALTLLIIANIHAGLKEYALSIDYLNKGIQIARKQNLRDLLSKIYLSYSDIYDQMGDNKTALGYYKLYNEAKDLVSGREHDEALNDLHARYQIEIKEREIELLSKDMAIQALETHRQKNQKNIYIGLVIFAFVLILLLLLLSNRYKLKKEKQRSDLEKQKQELENKLLLSQINPHFIFNSLNSINSYITGKDLQAAHSYLTMLAGLMRSILENTRKPVITIEDEISTLEMLLELEKMRYDNKFEYRLYVSDEIDPGNTWIPPMLVQPFVENAIIHGIKHKAGKGHIDIGFSMQSNLILCSICDDGIGRKKAAEILSRSKHKHKSLGLQLTGERLALLEMLSGSTLKVQITDLENDRGEATGTRVEMLIPCETE